MGGWVDITVTPSLVNQAPTADDDSIEVNREVATTITLSGGDADGDTLSFTIASTPANGTLGNIGTPSCAGTVCTADVTYTSNFGYTGPDSFTFTTNDGTVDSPTAGTISITVPAPPNQEPWAEDVKDLRYSLNPPAGVTITLLGYDPDGDSLEFFIFDEPDHGSLDPIGSPSCDGTSGGFAPMLAGSVCTAEVIYYPAADWTGPASFTYRVNDGEWDSNTATVSFTGPDS